MNENRCPICKELPKLVWNAKHFPQAIKCGCDALYHLSLKPRNDDQISAALDDWHSYKLRITEVTSPPCDPKLSIGQSKIPLHLWPVTATALGATAMEDGVRKYGRNNYRASKGVLASTYYAAALRHLSAWFEGEDFAEDSGIHHLGHALACLGILVDAQAAGTLLDDRNYPGGWQRVRKELETKRKEMTPMEARVVKHYTIGDSKK